MLLSDWGSAAHKVSLIGSGSYFNHDIILNNTSHELKFRNSNNYVTLDAVNAASDTTVTLPNATGTVRSSALHRPLPLLTEATGRC